MKNLFSTLAIVLISISSVMANNEPIPAASIFTIDAISFEMNTASMAAYSIEVIFEKSDNTIRMSAGSDVSFIQVLNAEGNLEYQLPIFSKEIIIDLDDFNQGLYQLNLMMDDENMVNSKFIKD